MKSKLRFTCDQWMRIRKVKHVCGRKPYCEVYPFEKHTWSYLCRWHYILDRLYCILTRDKTHGYYILDEKDIEGFEKYDI